MGIFTSNTKITSFNEFKYFKNAILANTAFYGCTALKEIEGTFTTTMTGSSGAVFYNTPIEKVKGKAVGSNHLLFANISSTSLDLSELDTTEMTRFDYAFRNITTLPTLDLSNWDTINVTSAAMPFGNGGTSYNYATKLIVSEKLFNCVTRETTPVTSLSFVGLTKWKDVTTLTNFMNALPDLSPDETTGEYPYTATSAELTFASAVKTVITNNSLDAIATAKGWTIA